MEVLARRKITLNLRLVADGRRIRSDRNARELAASLSWEPVPNEAEIDSQSEFTVDQLSADEFEAVWDRAW